MTIRTKRGLTAGRTLLELALLVALGLGAVLVTRTEPLVAASADTRIEPARLAGTPR